MVEMSTKLKSFSPSESHCDSVLWHSCQESQSGLKNAPLLKRCKSVSIRSEKEDDGEWGGRILEGDGGLSTRKPDNTHSPTS